MTSSDTPTNEQQITSLEAGIRTLETQRTQLGNSVVDMALQPLYQQLEALRKITRPTVALNAERKLVTVIFADISGFTALSEKLDPEQVRALVNMCFDCLVPVILEYGGTVDKFIGDAIMALFGAPVAYENHAERAVRAALEMRRALAEFNARRDIVLGLHIGINTGLVVAGGLGSQGQQQYSVIGDAVNLASRLEDASQTGQILVGPTTYRLVAPLFDFESLPPVLLKGKSQPIQVYGLQSCKAVPGSVRGIAGLHSPLVGRDAEKKRLRFVLENLRAGSGGRVAVSGEAGIGKSRLIAEVQQALPPGILWVEGRALSYTEGMSYWVARDLLYKLLNANAETPAAQVNAALWESVQRLFGERALTVYPYLARLLGLPLDQVTTEHVKHLTAEALRNRILNAYGDYIRARAREQPLVLMFEDLHWADPSSLTLLGTLLALADDNPVLLLFAFRPDEGRVQRFHQQALADYGEGYQVIDLRPLNLEDSLHLLDNLLNIPSMPEATRRLILAKSEGNAFFMEEILRSLIDTGLVSFQDGIPAASDSLGELQAIDVPDTLQGVVAARIDRLPGDDKKTLQTASVIGRVFQQRVLAYLFENDSSVPVLESSLLQLRRRELIRLRGDLEYIFKHAVTQDIAYSSLLMAQRKELHNATAHAIEKLFPDSLDDLSATLAYHYERAEARDKAIEYLRRAADRARSTYANTEAAAFYRSALAQANALLTDPVQGEQWREVARQLQENLGDILELIGQHEQARNAFQGAMEQVAQPDVITQSRLYRKIALTWSIQRGFDEALAAYAAARTVMGDALPSAASVWWQEWIQIALDEVWRVHYWRGQVPDMQRLAEAVRSATERYGTPIQRGKFFNNLVLMALRRDHYVVSKETLSNARASLDSMLESGDLNEIADARFMLGFTYLWYGDLDRAQEELQASLNLTERVGAITTKTRCLTYLAIICRKRGQVEAVRRYIPDCLTTATAGGMVEYTGMAKANLAWAHYRAADYARAQAEGASALGLLQQVSQGQMFPWVVFWPLIAAKLAQKLLAEAIGDAQTLLNSRSGQLVPTVLADILQSAATDWDAGCREAATLSLEKACQQATMMGYL